MASCKLVSLLYDAVPVRFVRALLLRSHIDECGRCQAALVSREEAKALFVRSSDVGGPEEIWRKLSGAVGSAPERYETVAMTRGRGLPRWQWAAGAAVLIAALAVSFWLLDDIERTGPGPLASTFPPERFEIKYVNVGGEPAQAFIYQPQGSETVFVWASKTP